MYNPYERQDIPPTQPYAQMQELLEGIVELYHKELMNIESYNDLLSLSPTMEDEELIQDIINHTNENILYLEQIYLGLTGSPLEQLPINTRRVTNISYPELLRNTLFSKTDTLEPYESIYRTVPWQPYKDILFNSIMCQLKDAAICNYLISMQV